MTRENDRIDAMNVLNDGLGRALADPAADMPMNRDQERILRSVARGLTVDSKAKPTGRRCGDCQLCCKLTPVKELNKGANTRCQYQRVGKGCTIYPHRPNSCRVWHCQWLVDPDAADLRRPDHSHYVVDVLPDYVTLKYDNGREPMIIPVIQIWVDPKFPDAHRDPALRALVMKNGENGVAAIIRYGERDGFVLFPPNMASDGQWHEEGSRADFTREKSLVDMVESGEFQMTATFKDEEGNTIETNGGEIISMMKAQR